LNNTTSESSATYAATAFCETLPKGRARGALLVGNDAAEFHANAEAGATTPGNNPAQVTFPLAGLQIKLGGASDRLVFLEHPDLPQWHIHTEDLAILKSPALHRHPQLAAAIAAMHGKRRRNWLVLIGAVVAICALPLLLIFNMDLLTLVAARQVPVEWEQKLGQSVFAQYRLDNELVKGRDIAEPLQRLTTTLTDAIEQPPYKFTFYIVRDSELNAFALPGGIVVINSGLIARADSAGELLGVVAHEISHVTARHGVRNIISTTGVVLTAQLIIGDASGLLATIASAAPILLNQSYSRDFEREADAQGIELLQRARIDPRGMESFFRKMLEREKKLLQQGKDDETLSTLKQLSQFLGTHPTTEERIGRLRKLTAEKSASYLNLDASFAQLKAAVAASESASSTDKDNTEEPDNADDT
jgi:predicted Zn-dependent protease